MIRLGREHYSIHREIYDWVLENTSNTWDNGYSIMFGYQEINLTPDQEVKFKDWLKRKYRREITS